VCYSCDDGGVRSLSIAAIFCVERRFWRVVGEKEQ